MKSCPHCGLLLDEAPLDPRRDLFPQSDKITTTHWHDTKFGFGKYEGQTVQSVLKTNPGYISWVKDNIDYVTFSNEVLDELYQALSVIESRRRERRTYSGSRYHDDDADWFHPDSLFDDR